MNARSPVETEFRKALLALDRLAISRLLASSEDSSPILQRIETLVIPALEWLGDEWEHGRVALSQVYMGGRICEQLVEENLTATKSARIAQPKMGLALLHDYHLLGKRMVYATLRGSGYEVLDYGRQDASSLVQKTCEDGIEVLLISTLMLPSALRVAQVREGLDRLGCHAKIVVGGAPFRFDHKLWREVGADAMCDTASDVLPVIASFSARSSEGRK